MLDFHIHEKHSICFRKKRLPPIGSLAFKFNFDVVDRQYGALLNPFIEGFPYRRKNRDVLRIMSFT